MRTNIATSNVTVLDGGQVKFRVDVEDAELKLYYVSGSCGLLSGGVFERMYTNPYVALQAATIEASYWIQT